MRALKIVNPEQNSEPADEQSWNGRLQMASLAPNGVKQLRNLVLGLAISGRLTKRDKNNIPVANILEKKGIKAKSSPIELLKKFQIPEAWEWMNIKDVCDLRTGATPNTSKKEYFGGNIKWLVSGDIHQKEIYDCEGRITDIGLEKSNCKILPENSVLIALNGQGKTRATVAILKVPAACNQSLVAITPKFSDIIMSEFIYLNLKYRYYEIRDITGQHQRRGLNMGLVGDLPISIPPLNEQPIIIEKTKEIIRLCDQLEAQKENATIAHEKLVSTLLNMLLQSQNAEEFKANWNRISTVSDNLFSSFASIFSTESSIDALKQAILQLAVMGKLVPQNPKDESASQLLKLIKIEKESLVKAGKIKRSKPPVKILDADMLYSLPKGWEWDNLLNCSKLVTDGEHLTPERTIDTTQIPLVTAKNVRDGYLDFAKTDFVHREVAEKCWVRCKPEKNDILIVSVGATIGRLSICDVETDMVIVRSVTLVKPLLINPEYLALALKSPFLQKMIWKGVKQNAQPCLYLSASQALSIPVPPLAEQSRIVNKVKEVMLLCDDLKNRLKNFNVLHNQLAGALVEKAIN